MMEAERVTESTLSTRYGTFDLRGYRAGGETHVALADLEAADDRPLVRIHSQCFTGDVLHSLACDCGAQLRDALERIGEEGGLLIYLRQGGRGIGLLNKLKAYELQDEEGLDTVEANERLGFDADERGYDAAAAILDDCGIDRLRLISNNPDKVAALEDAGFAVERVPATAGEREENADYLETKAEKLDHELEE